MPKAFFPEALEPVPADLCRQSAYSKRTRKGRRMRLVDGRVNVTVNIVGLPADEQCYGTTNREPLIINKRGALSEQCGFSVHRLGESCEIRSLPRQQYILYAYGPTPAIVKY